MSNTYETLEPVGATDSGTTIFRAQNGWIGSALTLLDMTREGA